jgi:Xaa-Pro dipeptidase
MTTAGDPAADPDSIFHLEAESAAADPPAPTETAEPAGVPERTAKRRADIDAKQAAVAKVLVELGCEGVILLMPAHVSWFTGGMNVRGLIADGERPGVYTNGRQRWLLCSNVDTQRLFDEELDGLGFQLKEWQWGVGRAVLLGELVAGKKFATDRPFPNMPMVNDKLRPYLRPLTGYETEEFVALGRVVAHAVEATARSFARGDSEEEVAGQMAHRLVHRGAEPAGLSVTADGRGKKFRRTGYTSAAVAHVGTLQATATRDGLYATAARTVYFGDPDADFRTAFDAAVKLSAVGRAMSVPGESVGSAADAGKWLLANTGLEYEWRFSQPGYGAGRFPAEELRRLGQEEKFAPGWPVTWQTRLGPAAVVDTVVVGETGPVAVTPPSDWPFKRIKVKDQTIDVPDLLVRS